VSTHAIGDRAIDWVVDTYSQVLAETPTQGLRHGLIHGNLPTVHAIETLARLQRDYDSGYPELQAPFLWWLGDNYAGNLGVDRAPHLIPLKTYQMKGIIWTGGSDYPVTPFPARYGLWSSVARETLHGTYGKQPFGTDESVDVHSALRSYTSWAARQLFLEDRIGSIEGGKEADLAIWDRNPYSVPTSELAKLHCEMTLVAGKVVFDSSREH
jgi:predicted amidohydrolase YtcJ